MQNEWILDVLADLKAFAQKNRLNVLAEQLDDTSLIAAAELASNREGKDGNERAPAEAVGFNSGIAGTRI